MISQDQLEDLGFGREAIRHRVRTGRLHALWPGVFAVGRPTVPREGRFTAAVLTCGEGACLYGESAAQHLCFRPARGGPIHVAVPYGRNPRRRAIKVHRRDLQPNEVTLHKGIPTVVPVIALIDLASRLRTNDLERAIGDADKTGLIDPETLRQALDHMPPRPGTGVLKRTLDRHTFVLTHTELERRFLSIVRRAGLPLPEGQRRHGAHRIDFFWPQLGLVVETDGLTYHRTAAQQAEDLIRDQAHTAAGLTTLRFSHSQIRFDPEHVEATLARVLTALSAFA